MMFLCNEGGLSNSCHGGSISLLQLFELPSEIDGALIWVGEGGHQSFFKINLANLHLFRDAMSDMYILALSLIIPGGTVPRLFRFLICGGFRSLFRMGVTSVCSPLAINMGSFEHNTVPFLIFQRVQQALVCHIQTCHS